MPNADGGLNTNLKRWARIHRLRSLAVHRRSKRHKNRYGRSQLIPLHLLRTTARRPMQMGVFLHWGSLSLVHIKNDKDEPSSARWNIKGWREGVEGQENTEDQPWSSSKHVSQTRTGFLEDGVRALLAEHSPQKMFPQCRQWCCGFREGGREANDGHLLKTNRKQNASLAGNNEEFSPSWPWRWSLSHRPCSSGLHGPLPTFWSDSATVWSAGIDSSSHTQGATRSTRL